MNGDFKFMDRSRLKVSPPHQVTEPHGSIERDAAKESCLSFSAPHFSAIISSNVRFLAEKWGAEKWDQLLSSIVFDLLSRWGV
jgi:hypothetical protein